MTILGDTGGGRFEPYASRKAAEASSDANAAQRQAKEAENQSARLRLACAAVWELVKEKTGLTEEELIAKIAVMDAKDGVADGKLTRSARKCVKCSRTVAGNQYKCMYCGEAQPVDSVFEGL